MERIKFYSDYRLFLKDFYSEQKRRHNFFSYRYFSQKAGVTSPALFKEVVDGVRNLTEKTTECFIKGLGLAGNDAAYFRALVHFNQTENEQEKLVALERLRGLRGRVKQEVVPIDLYEYFSTWYYPVVRELACLFDWKNDYHALARAVVPPIKKAEAQKAVGFLLEKGFLGIDELGRYVQTHPALSTGSEVSSLAIRAFNELMIKRGEDALKEIPPAERDIRSLVVGISARSYSLIKEEIREFVSHVVRIVDDDKTSDRVYGISFQFFPLSRSNRKEGVEHEDA